jgi:lipopolysaccharide exporter
MSTLGHRVAKSAAWMIGARLALRGIGLVSTVFLARLLRPDDFGLVALAMALVGTVEILGNFSFDLALIREGRATRDHYDTVWTLTIIRGAAVGGALAALARPAAVFFGDARVEPIVYCLAVATLLDGFQNVGVVDFRKELLFYREFVFQVVAKIVSFLATITFAILWREYWALVIGIVAGRIAGLGLSYMMHAHRPRFTLVQWRALVGFSKWLLAANISNFLGSRLDTFALGRLAGAHALGLYEISNEISSLPTGELIWPIQRALFPGYAKLLGDPVRLSQGYLRGLAIIAMIAMPAAVGIACIARLIVDVFLGPQWIDALPLLQVLAIAGVLKVGYANSFTVLLSLGRAKLLSTLAALNFALFALLVVVGTTVQGAIGAAVAAVVTSGIMLCIYVTITLQALSLGFGELIAAVWRTMVAVLIMATSTYTFMCVWPADGVASVEVPEMLASMLLAAATYVGAHLCLWRMAGSPDGPEEDVLSAFAPLAHQFLARLNSSTSLSPTTRNNEPTSIPIKGIDTEKP